MKYKNLAMTEEIYNSMRILSALKEHRSLNQTINIAMQEYIDHNKKMYGDVLEKK